VSTRARWLAPLGCLLALSLPRPAAALHLGGVFGGAVRAGGASAYWNPAAVAQHPGSWVVLAEGVGFFSKAHYARAGRHPGTGEPYEAVEFSQAVPNFAFTLAAPTPAPWLQLVAGGFTATAAGVDWPEDGPQRYHATRSYVLAYAVTLGAVVSPGPDWGVALTAGPMLGLLHVNYSIDLGAMANGELAPGAEPLPLEDPLLEGRTHVRADDWAWVAGLGAWGRPASWLRLGAFVLVPSDLTLSGTVDVDAPEQLAQALPGFTFGSRGDIELGYALGWELHLEAEATLGAWSAALLGSYAASGERDVVVSDISGSELELLEGRQNTISDKQDDWLVGLRVSHRLRPDWEVGARVDVDPLSISREAMHAGNLDFTSVQLGVGARWELDEGRALELAYTAYLIWDNVVSESVFDPRAPRDSGLGTPSANGTFQAGAHVVSLGFTGLFGG